LRSRFHRRSSHREISFDNPIVTTNSLIVTTLSYQSGGGDAQE
jgi:hypothetical protein